MNIEKSILRFIDDMGIDDLESIASLYQDYINECNGLINEIELNMQILGASDLEKIIHNIKGVSSNLYIDSMYEVTETFDNYLKTHINEHHLNEDMLSMWRAMLQVYAQTSHDIFRFFENRGYFVTLK